MTNEGSQGEDGGELQESSSSDPGQKVETPPATYTTTEDPSSLDLDVPSQGPSSATAKVNWRQQIHWEGEFPPPQILAQYNEAADRGADRIMSMAEQQAAHRRRIEEKIVDAQIADMEAEREERKRGQFYALLIGLAGFLAGSIVACVGDHWATQLAGGLIGAGGIGGIIATFIHGRELEKARAEAESSTEDSALPIPRRKPS